MRTAADPRMSSAQATAAAFSFMTTAWQVMVHSADADMVELLRKEIFGFVNFAHRLAFFPTVQRLT